MGTHQKYMNRYATSIRHNGEIAKYFLEEEYATGTIIRCELAAGMEMLFFDYHVRKDQVMADFEKGNILEIFYCLQGSVEMKYGSNTIELKENGIGIYDFNSCPDEVRLKKGSVKGISLLLDGKDADGVISRYFSAKSVTFKTLQEEIAKEQRLLLTFGNGNLTSVFLEIAENPFDYEKEYLLLKALELIWISSHCIKKDRKNQEEKRSRTNRYRIFEKAVLYMEYHIGDDFTMEELAEEMGIAKKVLNQLFKDYANHSAFAHLKELRLQKAKELLLQTDSTITEIAGEVGWTNASKFTASFKSRFGLTPQEYRKENKYK